MNDEINYNKIEHVFCICEGGIERALMNLLLDEDKLLVKRDILWDGKLIPKNNRSSKDFQKNYLKGIKINTEKTLVIRILDNPNSDKFILSNKSIKVIDYVTPPEIEMIFIIKLGFLDEFNKDNHRKPSVF